MGGGGCDYTWVLVKIRVPFWCRTTIGTQKRTIILRNHPHYTCFVDFCWEGLRFSDLRALGFGVWGSGCKVWGISVFNHTRTFQNSM